MKHEAPEEFIVDPLDRNTTFGGNTIIIFKLSYCCIYKRLSDFDFQATWGPLSYKQTAQSFRVCINKLL